MKNKPPLVNFLSNRQILAIILSVIISFCLRVSVIANDATLPTVVSVNFTPTSIDVTNSPQSVVVTVRITDDISGFTSGVVYFVRPSPQSSGGEAVAFITSANRISGTANDGIYQATAIIPQSSQAGIWKQSRTYVQDQAQNAGTRLANTYVAGLPPDLMVASANPDTFSPRVVSVNFTPTSIDVTNSPQSLIVTAHIIDNISGFTSGSVYFTPPSGPFTPPSGIGEAVAFINSTNRISGTANDGIYQATVTVPQSSQAGIWEQSRTDVRDQAQNGDSRTRFDYTAGIPPDLMVASANPDTTLPTVVSVNFTPTSVDVTDSSQSVIVTVRITDNISGFTSGAVYFTRPAGGGEAVAFINSANRISGTANDGIYQATATIPQFAPAGTWRQSRTAVQDQAQNNGSQGSSTNGFLTVTSKSAPGPTPTPSPSPTATPGFPPAKLGNISTRLRVGTGDNVLIGGFIISGTQPKKIILRAIGPSLPVAGKVGNPTLELVGPGGAIAFNDDWRSTQEAAIIASTVPPADNFESAIVATVPANNSGYTAIMRGAGNTTGVGLVEVYDLDPAADSELANISTRGVVEAGENVMIGGFILSGSALGRVIVRAIGPSLPVNGKLADPTVQLFDGNGTQLGSNDDWRNGGQENEIIGTGVAPSNELESAFILNLPAGAQTTAIVRGKNGSAGVALVEVFSLR